MIHDMGEERDPLRFAAGSNVRKLRDQDLGLDDGGYALDRFYCASTNAHDHSETIQLKLPKHVKVLINQFVGNDELPAYRSVNDVVRDALVHRLQWIQDFYAASPALKAWIIMETTRNQLETIQAEMTAQRQLVEFFREVIDSAVADQDRTTMELITTTGTAMIQQAREPYRSQALEHLRRGYVALGMDDAALVEMVAEESADVFDPTVEIGQEMGRIMAADPHN